MARCRPACGKQGQEVVVGHFSRGLRRERIKQYIVALQGRLVLRKEADGVRTDYKAAGVLFDQTGPSPVQSPAGRDLLLEDDPRQVDCQIAVLPQQPAKNVGVIGDHNAAADSGVRPDYASVRMRPDGRLDLVEKVGLFPPGRPDVAVDQQSEEHTSELQSLRHLVCRLLLEK